MGLMDDDVAAVHMMAAPPPPHGPCPPPFDVSPRGGSRRRLAPGPPACDKNDAAHVLLCGVALSPSPPSLHTLTPPSIPPPPYIRLAVAVMKLALVLLLGASSVASAGMGFLVRTVHGLDDDDDEYRGGGLLVGEARVLHKKSCLHRPPQRVSSLTRRPPPPLSPFFLLLTIISEGVAMVMTERGEP